MHWKNLDSTVYTRVFYKSDFSLLSVGTDFAVFSSPLVALAPLDLPFALLPPLILSTFFTGRMTGNHSVGSNIQSFGDVLFDKHKPVHAVKMRREPYPVNRCQYPWPECQRRLVVRS